MRTVRPSAHHIARISALGLVVLVIALGVFLYVHRVDRCVLYYYGASPEVPQGTAVAILNPFRDRADEANAEKLIRDLRTSRCSEIVREELNVTPECICSAVQHTTHMNLIWLDIQHYAGNWKQPRRLYYDLPETRARLVLYFHTDEAGWESPELQSSGDREN
jgi:hypothetical protein